MSYHDMSEEALGARAETISYFRRVEDMLNANDFEDEEVGKKGDLTAFHRCVNHSGLSTHDPIFSARPGQSLVHPERAHRGRGQRAPTGL